ncbi:glycoside hydrolase family 19 protein [Mesorhizobium qingshengii]|uniref:Glycoside hydrolase family 19 protein n=1 Tax=Mesorhizobium qingshengii TaxID=1165689 RepID=A0ABT4QZC1_9HYPH|nr:glycoside hydrolase family 19 protein [Mesorhizobium qingshengii]MCZ8546908.1 glycoside hydrolase family 19 protein [Mesorhizobium qingshengii]
MTRTFSEALAQLCPNASKTIIAGIADNLHLLDQAGISTPIRVRHFFARVCVETGGLHTLEENLNYSARRAHEVWPGRFPTAASAGPFANNPAKLAEKVYGGRLGNFAAGDGWKYRGSGLLQNTGRENFEEVEAATGLPVVANPDLLRGFPGALLAATIYWSKRNINALADRNDVAGVCKAVNGSAIGLADQKAWLAKAAKVWPDGAGIAFPAAPADPPAKPVPDPAAPAMPPQVAPIPPVAPGPTAETGIPVSPAGEAPAVRPVASAKPTSSGGKAAVAAGAFALIVTALAAFWRHVTELLWSIF